MNTEKYADIIGLPRPVSSRHPRMSNANRAKQFMPFAALRGYGDEIEERQVIYEPRIQLSEEDWTILNERLNAIGEALRRGQRPRVTVEYFEPRPAKAGGGGEEAPGLYRTFTGPAEKLLADSAALRVGGRTFAFDDIVGLWQEEDDDRRG